MKKKSANSESTRHVFRFIGTKDGEAAWQLDQEEAWHASKVLRLDDGTEVEVTDGRGTLIRGTLNLAASRPGKNACVTVTEQFFSDHDPVQFEMILGALKPGDIDEILPGVVELGAAKISIYLPEHTGKERISSKAMERWRRILVTAMKQSKRLWLPEITCWDSLEDCLDNHRTRDGSAIRWIFTEPGLSDSDGKQAVSALTAITAAHRAITPQRQNEPTGSWLCGIVGSEKGFSPGELQAVLSAGFMPVAIAPHVLRSKTAIPAAATILAMAASSYR